MYFKALTLATRMHLTNLHYSSHLALRLGLEKSPVEDFILPYII